MFSFMSWILHVKAALLFFKYKTTVASAVFFLAGNYQLQVKSQTHDRLKERKKAKEYRAIKLIIILCSFFFSLVTVVLSVMPFPL